MCSCLPIRCVFHCLFTNPTPSDVPGQTLSDREALSLHSEIKALQDRLGLSYKDAAHRLYMSEVEKLRSEKHAARAMKSIRTRIDNTIVERIFPPISKLDGEEVSGQVEGAETVEGSWPK
jgi:hypothetical protein